MLYRFTILFVSLLLITHPAYAETFPPIDVEMSLKKVSDHVYYVQGKAGVATDNKGFISNSAFVISEEGVLIFDALGSPSLAQKYLGLIRQVTDKPIKKLFISHYHADHIYGTQLFKSQGVEVLAPKGAADYYNSEGADVRLNERRKSLKPWVSETTQVVIPDKLIGDDYQFRFGELSIDVISFGSAHSHGDLALYVKEDGVLLTGDLVFTGRVPFVGGNDIQNWIAKIDYLEKIPAKKIVPGHGAVFTDLAVGAELTRSYLVLLRDSMAAGVEELMSFDDVYSSVDWSRFEKLPAFKRGNRGNAYRVFLAAEAKSLNE